MQQGRASLPRAQGVQLVAVEGAVVGVLALGNGASRPAPLVQALPGRGSDVHDLRVPKALYLGGALPLGRHLQEGQGARVGQRSLYAQPWEGGLQLHEAGRCHCGDKACLAAWEQVRHCQLDGKGGGSGSHLQGKGRGVIGGPAGCSNSRWEGCRVEAMHVAWLWGLHPLGCPCREARDAIPRAACQAKGLSSCHPKCRQMAAACVLVCASSAAPGGATLSAALASLCYWPPMKCDASRLPFGCGPHLDAAGDDQVVADDSTYMVLPCRRATPADIHLQTAAASNLIQVPNGEASGSACLCAC